MESITKLGKCPSCNEDWDSGTIVDNLTNLDVFFHKTSTEVSKIANKTYGWTPENNNHFSKAIVYDIDGDEILQCPNCGNYISSEYPMIFDELSDWPMHLANYKIYIAEHGTSEETT